VESLAAERAEEIEAKADLPTAKRWYRLATSKGPTLREAWGEWMAVCEHNAATKLKDEQAFRYFLEWLAVADAFPPDITNETARDYIRHVNTEATSARGGPLAKATREARIGPLRLFWREHLEHNDIVPSDVNPWRNPKLGGRRKASDDQTDKKRPYTDREIVALLHGPELADGERTSYPKRTLMELYALGFYTGARIGEIANRLVRDLEKIKGGYTLHIRSGTKTEESMRSIPILHPIPVAVLKRRIGDRSDPDAQLFVEFIPGGPLGSLAWYPSKALGRYRDKVGLGTATDTHSTRRQLITDLVSKGHPLTLVQFYVGHKPQGITAGVYATPTSAGLRKIAEAITYPPKIERAFRAALGIR
jgi:integrase